MLPLYMKLKGSCITILSYKPGGEVIILELQSLPTYVLE